MQNNKVIIDSDLCVNCVFYFGVDSCMAFPDKIPDEILHGDNQHNKPMENQDNDIVFTQL